MQDTDTDSVVNLLRQVAFNTASANVQLTTIVEELHALNLALAELTRETKSLTKSPALGIFGLGR